MIRWCSSGDHQYVNSELIFLYFCLWIMFPDILYSNIYQHWTFSLSMNLRKRTSRILRMLDIQCLGFQVPRDMVPVHILCFFFSVGFICKDSIRSHLHFFLLTFYIEKTVWAATGISYEWGTVLLMSLLNILNTVHFSVTFCHYFCYVFVIILIVFMFLFLFEVHLWHYLDSFRSLWFVL